ncbi:MAG: elongation factor Ts [Candidatus Aureabacteria bacterium]|nr:elongation factor Ts [Candidatus Auribacterota bacterium]
MVEITAQMVKELRDKTNVGMMDCKTALVEAEGDMEKSIEILRKKGMAVAAKRSGKETKEGTIASHVSSDMRTGVLVEVNSETDFVARNEMFRAFVTDVAEHIVTSGPKDVEELLSQKFVKNSSLTVQDALTDIMGKIGENIKVRRFERIASDDKGAVSDYIHMGGKIGVLVKIGFEKPETSGSQEIKELMKNLCMQIAAASPAYIREGDIPSAVLEKEKEIQKAQIKGKPENIVDKIVEGKMKKYYSEVCLIHQPYVKEQKISVKDYVASVSKSVNDQIDVKCFVRFMLGEDV